MPVAKDVAKGVTYFAKCVPVVSSALQVVVMCASSAETGMEIRHVKVEWHFVHARLEVLPGAIVKSMIPVLHRDGQVDELLGKNVFKVLPVPLEINYPYITSHVIKSIRG